MPRATALFAPGRSSLSYQQLFAQVQKIREQLNDLGIGQADRVAVSLPNGPEMAVAFLAVASRATCAPLNPTYNAEEFKFYLGDLEARAAIVPAGAPSPLREVCQALGIPVLELCARPEDPAGIFDLEGPRAGERQEASLPEESSIALALHTSGTTSRPKMVPLAHKNLCLSGRNVAQTLNLGEADRCLNIMPLFHIHGLVAALLATLTAGGSVICSPGLKVEQFFGWLAAFRPTWYTAVPTMHQTILAAAGGQEGIIAEVGLRLIRSSSASLAPKVMRDLEETFHCPVIEAYGMTEAAHQMASNPLPPWPRKPGSVGPAAGPQVAIMDEAGQFLPPGSTGEVVIRGENVMAGYVNNPEANRTAFTGGWFRTGDNGYLDEEGYLFLTGRLKEIINRGGEKISPREVDEVVLEHPAVTQAVTFGVPHRTLGEDVVCAVVLRPGERVEPQEIRRYTLERLAAHKVPTQVLVVSEIPKGATGKIQRIGLGAKLAHLLRPAYVAPADELERELAAIWQEILGEERIGSGDNFFSLGGNSLMAAQVLSRIASLFQVELPTRAFFETPTVAGIAQLIRLRTQILQAQESTDDYEEGEL